MVITSNVGGTNNTTIDMNLYNSTQLLANKLQETWETSEYLFYRNLSDSAPCEDTRNNCKVILRYMAQGLHDFRRNYRVSEVEDAYRVIYNCNVTGMPMIHCVVSKETGDLARQTTDLVERARHQFNLLDPRSREACLAVASYDGGYLK